MWVPRANVKWYRLWLTGWRLVLVIVGLILIYGVIWGPKDYRSLKTWRARSLAREALALPKTDAPAAAIALLEKAGTLAPNDTEVLRSLADFNEPRQDIMALYALRKLVSGGNSTEEDRERLCRLAFDWGMSEMAPSETLRKWAKSDPQSLEIRALELSARWMAGRGQPAEAETRLRFALEKAEPGITAASIESALCRLLLASPAAQANNEATIKEILLRLEHVISTTTPPSPIRSDAAKLLALIHSRPVWISHISSDLSNLTIKALHEQAEALKSDPAAAMTLKISTLGVQLALKPWNQKTQIAEFLEATKEEDPKERLTIVRWLVSREYYLDALAVCEAYPASKTDKEWFTVLLDALFGLKEWEEVAKAVSAENQPLVEITKRLFYYRTVVASGQAPALQEKALAAVLAAAEQAAPRDILYVAGNLEKTRELIPAHTLYSGLQNHSVAGLAARLGMIRCLDPQLDKSGELIVALESLLRLWPHSDEARSDLAYLRLLDKNARNEDVEAVKELTKNSPWFLAYRIPAALALLREKESGKALQLLEREPIPWEKVRAGWQSVYVATLAANGRSAEAKKIAATIPKNQLRPGERRLLEESLAILP